MTTRLTGSAVRAQGEPAGLSAPQTGTCSGRRWSGDGAGSLFRCPEEDAGDRLDALLLAHWGAAPSGEASKLATSF